MFYINIDSDSEKKYDISNFMDLQQGVYNPFSSYMIYMIQKLPPAGRYTILDAEKPELISFKIYGDTQYWWILMIYNGLTIPNQLTLNKMIQYPSLRQIEQLYLNASINQKVNND